MNCILPESCSSRAQISMWRCTFCRGRLDVRNASGTRFYESSLTIDNGKRARERERERESERKRQRCPRLTIADLAVLDRSTRSSVSCGWQRIRERGEEFAGSNHVTPQRLLSIKTQSTVMMRETRCT